MKIIDVTAFKDIISRKSDDSSIAIINVCTPIEYAEEHIAGVQNIPLDALPQHLDELRNKKVIYVHCKTGNRGQKAAELLDTQGLSAEIINVEGGLTAWNAAGLATVKNTARVPFMRQTLLSAGTLVTLGILLSIMLHPYFIYLALFVGCGLMFAGITGWCGMSLLLAKMPWNK